jgi:hypothetical protein
MAVYAVSPQASATTGAALRVDGGHDRVILSRLTLQLLPPLTPSGCRNPVFASSRNRAPTAGRPRVDRVRGASSSRCIVSRFCRFPFRMGIHPSANPASRQIGTAVYMQGLTGDKPGILHGRLLRWQFDTVTLAHRCRRGASTPSPGRELYFARRNDGSGAHSPLRGAWSTGSSAPISAVRGVASNRPELDPVRSPNRQAAQSLPRVIITRCLIMVREHPGGEGMGAGV